MKKTFLFIIFLIFGNFQLLAFERVKPGNTMYVACKNLYVHSLPTAFSNIVGTLNFGSNVMVKGLEKTFELPDSDFSSKKKLIEREKKDAKDNERLVNKIDPFEYTRAAWIKIDNNKYVSNSCLVSKSNLKDQDEKIAQNKVDKLASSKAKRNFSEEEEGDMTAMRGAAGKAKGGPADYKRIEQFINSSQGKVNFSLMTQFRKNGFLGEFK